MARGRYTGVLDALRRVAVLEGGKKALYSGAATMSAWTLASCTLQYSAYSHFMKVRNPLIQPLRCPIPPLRCPIPPLRCPTQPL